jgi:hypothetical protein
MWSSSWQQNAGKRELRLQWESRRHAGPEGEVQLVSSSIYYLLLMQLPKVQSNFQDKNDQKECHQAS